MKNKDYIMNLIEALDAAFNNFKSSVYRRDFSNAERQEDSVKQLLTELHSQIESQNHN